MSYDVDAECGHCGYSLANWNYTTNCAPMWRAAGAQIHDWDGKLVEEILPEFDKALEELRAHPEKYIKMNPENGWGSYTTLVPSLGEFLSTLRRVARKAPQARIRVSR